MRPITRSATLVSLGGLDPAMDVTGRTGPISSTLKQDQHTTVLAYFGDSVITCSELPTYNPSNSLMQDVHLGNGQLYTSQSPALSGGGPGNDNTLGFWGHRLGNSLMQNGRTGRVIHCGAGVNTTGTVLWATSPYNERIKTAWVTLNGLDVLGADRVIILVSLGGLDQINAVSAATVKSNLDTIFAAIRTAGFLSQPIVLAGHSWAGGGTGGANGTAVRAAQVQAVNQNFNVYTGPDTDVIPLGERHDTNHYNATGSVHAAALWYTAIQGLFP